MEVFTGARYIRLRCHERRGMYLAADVDGVGVCITSQRGVHNTVWGVEHAQGPDGLSVLLRGAYGRYLFATGQLEGVTDATQADLDQMSPPLGMLWHAVRRRGAFLLRCGLGRYLRANGRHRWWRREVTVAEDNHSTMMKWAVEGVPLLLTRPHIRDRLHQLTHRARPPPTEAQMTRLIRFVRCEANGSINEASWRTIEVRTTDLMELRYALAHSYGPIHQNVGGRSLCVRAGHFARYSPLHIDLPIGNNRIDIVIVAEGTPVHNSLRFPDVIAP